MKEKNKRTKDTPSDGKPERAGQPLLGDVNGGSILIDRLIKEFDESPQAGIDHVWYKARPIGYRTRIFKKRLLGAWYVLTGFSIAVHFAEDEAKKARH